MIVSAVAGASAAENREQRTVGFNNTEWVVDLASESERITDGTEQQLVIVVTNEEADDPEPIVTILCTKEVLSNGTVKTVGCVVIQPPPSQ